jgi:hypothetical protein
LGKPSNVVTFDLIRSCRSSRKRVNLVAANPRGVQFSPGFSRDQALANYAMLAKRYAEVLSRRYPSPLTSVMCGRGTCPYRVRGGADTGQGADSLCGRIRRAGGACMVLRNGAS